MGIQNLELFQKITGRPGVRGQEPGKGWGKGNSSKIKGAIREKLLDFSLLYPSDIRITGIVHVEVIPKNDAIWF